MSTPTSPTPANPDRVARPVGLAAVAGLVLAALGNALLDGAIDPEEQHQLLTNGVNLALAAVPALLAWLAARRARGNVTPILPGDHPQDLDGTPLKPAGHGPAQGYPRVDPDPGDTDELLKPWPRVDRRGVDRDPPPGRGLG